MLIAVNVLPLCWEEALSISLVEGAGVTLGSSGLGYSNMQQDFCDSI